MLKGLYILDTHSYDTIYGPQERKEIESRVDIYASQQTSKSVMANPDVLHDVQVIFSGWGAPHMDKTFLDAVPSLRAVFYGAGSVREVVTEEFWKRGLRITSAYAANAVPVAEYTLSQVLFCLKQGWHYSFLIKTNSAFPPLVPVPGAYGSVVGIVSLGMIGRLVCNLLRSFDLKVIAYDPYVDETTAAELGVELCSLQEVFKRADVVTLHTPLLEATKGMILGEHFRAMKTGASFINTARGAIVREDEMIGVLKTRPDIQVVLDVTDPEPPEVGSLLYTLPNVVLTPHIAGSMDNECRRMGRYMVEELDRYLRGEEMMWEITREKADLLA